MTTERVSYLSLQHKKQLAILCLARIADPLASTSLNAYVFYQLKFISPSASDAAIATQVGILVGAKTASKVGTGIVWGRLADANHGGRKLVLLIGLTTSCLGSLGYGYSSSFATAVFWQIFSGAMSSNVGIIRCVVAELNPEKRHQSRALLLIALFGSVGTFLGPLIGGLLSPNDGEATRDRSSYPYATPNLVVAASYATAALGVMLFVDETLVTHERQDNLLQRVWHAMTSVISSTRSSQYAYTPLQISNDATPTNEEESPPSPARAAPRTSFLSIWTPQVLCLFTTQFFLVGALGSFGPLWTVFLSTPTAPRSTPTSFLAIPGGIGLSPASIGVLLSLHAAFGILLQLTIYPPLNDRFGTLRIFRAGLLMFPLTYLVAPLPALVASHFATPGATSPTPTSTAFEVWLAISSVLLLGILGRTAVTPGMSLLVNDCVPAPDARATVNTASNVVSALSKCFFPVIALAIYSWGLRHEAVNLSFWALGLVSVVAVVASRWVGGVNDAMKAQA